MAANLDTFSLWDLPLHTSAQLVGFSAKLQDRYQGRLREFGFRTGEEVSCLHQPGFGAPRVFRVSNATYSLDRELSEQVLVTRLAGHANALRVAGRHP